MDIQRTPTYRSLAKGISTRAKLRLRRRMRIQAAMIHGEIYACLKPFSGQPLADCKEQVKAALLKKFHELADLQSAAMHIERDPNDATRLLVRMPPVVKSFVTHQEFRL